MLPHSKNFYFGKKFLIFGLIFVLAGLALNSLNFGEVMANPVSAPFTSEQFVVFGPKDYVRTTGAPNVYTDTFEVELTNSTPSPFVLNVQNGDGQNSRISSAIVELNGQIIFNESNFNQQVSSLQVPVVLISSNTLRVTVKSIPGSFLRIWVSAILTVTGKVEWDTGGLVAGAGVRVFDRSQDTKSSTITKADGTFRVFLNPASFPTKVLAEASIKANSGPLITNSKWSNANGIEGPGQFNLGSIKLTNPVGAELSIVNSTAKSSDGTVTIKNLPANVTQVFSRSYDPDVSPEVFPGEFIGEGIYSLNSTVFLSINATDGQGNPVVDSFVEPPTSHLRVPESQWKDLEDLARGNGRIDIPIYSYDYPTGNWIPKPDGWLEDTNGLVISEIYNELVVNGTYPGPIFAVFRVDHFSWWNVDYAFIGPWTLSRLPSDKRNNKCLFDALNLAKKIVQSQAGQNAYAKVNDPGANINDELKDGLGPELKTFSPANPQKYGEYTGEDTGPKDEFTINTRLWNFCTSASTESQRKAATLMMALTILHETAHWKDDVKKTGGDTADEEGWQLERDLIGQDLFLNDDGTIRQGRTDGPAVSQTDINNWLNPNTWPPPPPPPPPPGGSHLDLSLSLAKTSFGLGESILVQVTYTNTSEMPIEVLGKVVLEDYPIRFDIIHSPTGKKIDFKGGERRLGFASTDYVTLQPGQSFMQTVDLVLDEQGQAKRYNFNLGGNYTVKALYSPFTFLGGHPGIESNILSFNLTCTPSVGGYADGKDNDCDGQADEELRDNLDNDNDGKVDEDLGVCTPSFAFNPDGQDNDCDLKIDEEIWDFEFNDEDGDGLFNEDFFCAFSYPGIGDGIDNDCDGKVDEELGFDGIDNDGDGRVDEDVAPVPCTPTATLPGDGLDNDCDGNIDEELADGIDDDLDGLVDEDLMPSDRQVIIKPGIDYSPAK